MTELDLFRTEYTKHRNTSWGAVDCVTGTLLSAFLCN